jgi:hypothetical protein
MLKFIYLLHLRHFRTRRPLSHVGHSGIVYVPFDRKNVPFVSHRFPALSTRHNRPNTVPQAAYPHTFPCRFSFYANNVRTSTLFRRIGGIYFAVSLNRHNPKPGWKFQRPAIRVNAASGSQLTQPHFRHRWTRIRRVRFYLCRSLYISAWLKASSARSQPPHSIPQAAYPTHVSP